MMTLRRNARFLAGVGLASHNPTDAIGTFPARRPASGGFSIRPESPLSGTRHRRQGNQRSGQVHGFGRLEYGDGLPFEAASESRSETFSSPNISPAIASRITLCVPAAWLGRPLAGRGALVGCHHAAFSCLAFGCGARPR